VRGNEHDERGSRARGSGARKSGEAHIGNLNRSLRVAQFSPLSVLPWYSRAMIFALLLALAAPDSEHYFGAPLLPGAHQEEEPGRYRAGRNYDDTVEFYERMFKGNAKYHWKKIINQPQVKAIHLQNTQPKPGEWSGMNIYDVAGTTHLYVLKAEEKKKAKGR
jgi:hypothetical protein